LKDRVVPETLTHHISQMCDDDVFRRKTSSEEDKKPHLLIALNWSSNLWIYNGGSEQ